MKRPTNVHKFKLAMALLGVLLAGVIGYTLWFVSHSEKVANDAYAKSNNSYTVKPDKKVASAQPAQTQQYLTIKEWGVQIPLTSDESDLTYVAKTEEGTTFYRILSPSIAKLCGVGWDGEIGRIGRSQIDPSKQGSYEPQVKIGTYFYTFAALQNTCSNDDVIAKKDGAASVALGKQFKLLQAVPQKYLTFKEWGVKAPIATGLTLTYAIQGNDASLSSSELKAVSAMCAEYGGNIIRAKPNDLYMESGDDGQTAAAYAAKLDKLSTSRQYAFVNGYYYFFQHDQGGCSNDDHVLSLQTQTNDAVKALVPTIVSQ